MRSRAQQISLLLASRLSVAHLDLLVRVDSQLALSTFIIIIIIITLAGCRMRLLECQQHHTISSLCAKLVSRVCPRHPDSWWRPRAGAFAFPLLSSDTSWDYLGIEAAPLLAPALAGSISCSLHGGQEFGRAFITATRTQCEPGLGLAPRAFPMVTLSLLNNLAGGVASGAVGVGPMFAGGCAFMASFMMMAGGHTD